MDLISHAARKRGGWSWSWISLVMRFAHGELELDLISHAAHTLGGGAVAASR